MEPVQGISFGLFAQVSHICIHSHSACYQSEKAKIPHSLFSSNSLWDLFFYRIIAINKMLFRESVILPAHSTVDKG